MPIATMKCSSALCLFVALLPLLAPLCAAGADDFDFFYFVLQWPGSYCDTRKACCYPKTGKPAADFGIHGLWPNFKDGSYPSNCDPDSPYDESKIKDLIPSMQKNWPTLACPSGNGTTFWTHEWEKHGTCSESSLDQHAYFQHTLALKKEADILKFLEDAGIHPGGESYSLGSIKDAIKKGTGAAPWIQCNVDQDGNKQLYQVYICVDTSGEKIIECPVLPRGQCAPEIAFPTF